MQDEYEMETVTWLQRPPGQRPVGPEGQQWDAPRCWQTALRAPLVTKTKGKRRSTGLNGKKWNFPTCTRRGPVVHVSTGADGRHAVDFDANETIAAFKLRLASIAGTPPEQQILVYAAKELQDGRTLGDYCITEGSVVHLTVRLRGGMRDNGQRFPPPSFLVRNLTDTTGRKLFMCESTVPLNSLPVPSGPYLFELHRRTYERLANGAEW